MPISRFSLHSAPAEKKFLTLCTALLFLGSLAGTLCAVLQCRNTPPELPPLSALSVQIVSRGIPGLLLTDVLFSSLILFLALVRCAEAVYPVLFAVKGFCIAYLIFLFVFVFRSGGFLFAASVLLFHSFLLLPLQFSTAFFLGFLQDRVRRKCVTFTAANAAALLLCLVFDRCLLPEMLSVF